MPFKFLVLFVSLILLPLNSIAAPPETSLRPRLRAPWITDLATFSSLNFQLRAEPNPQWSRETQLSKELISTAGGDSSGGGFLVEDEQGRLTLLDFSVYMDQASDLFSITQENPQPMTGFRPHYEILGFQRAGLNFF